MRYSVVAPDGQKYGPADLSILNQWAAEGRLSHDSEMEEEGTGARMQASRVLGLVFPAPSIPTQPQPQVQPQYPVQNPLPPQTGPFEVPSQQYPQQNWQQPPNYANYPRSTAGSSLGQGELTAAWILGAVTFAFFCCPILPGIGLIMANKATNLGNPSAQSARIFNIVVLSLSLMVYVGYFLIFVFAIGAGASGGFR